MTFFDREPTFQSRQNWAANCSAHHLLDWLEQQTTTSEKLRQHTEVDESPGQTEDPPEPPFRIWHDDSGKKTVMAKLTKIGESRVTLTKEDGQTVEVALERLSQDDREYVEDRRSREADGP